MTEGKKEHFLRCRLTEAEHKLLEEMLTSLGLTSSEIIRQALFSKGNRRLADGRQLLRKLDTLGTEMARAGNNINQLARHANTLHNRGALDGSIISDFYETFNRYLEIRAETAKTMRELIRLIRH